MTGVGDAHATRFESSNATDTRRQTRISRMHFGSARWYLREVSPPQVKKTLARRGSLRDSIPPVDHDSVPLVTAAIRRSHRRIVSTFSVAALPAP